MKQNTDDIFKDLFRRYYPSLLVYARSMVGAEEAEDVVEDVFTELWRRQDKTEMGDRIWSYLSRAVYTRSLNVLKHRHVTAHYVTMVDEINRQRMSYIDLYNPQRYLENENLREMLETAIAELPEKCREVFRLSYLHGLKNSEIAAALEISVKTVEAHIYKALKYLRERLKGARKLLPLLLFLFFN